MSLFDDARQYLRNRAHAYHVTFQGPMAEVVLADLAKFCRATESTFHVDPRAHAVQEGRREVWLRLQSHMKMSDDDLWKRYGGSTPMKETP